MAVSLYNIKKWWLMLTGNSILHVNQNEGLCYSTKELKGYYNNLTEKVLKSNINDNSIPTVTLEINNRTQEIIMTTAVFQYALGAYDLYLINKDKEMLSKVINCANWAIENQKNNGGWITFDYIYPDAPYSAMSTGEGISLLLRVYKETGNELYLTAADKAYTFLITDVEKGGVSKIDSSNLYLYEYTHKPLVLNGWIFAFWGLYDYNLFYNTTKTHEILTLAAKTLSKYISSFDRKFWSNYDIKGKIITSPFYHKLHIAQLKILYEQTSDEVFLKYAELWQSYNKNLIYKTIAFIMKAYQKIKE